MINYFVMIYYYEMINYYVIMIYYYVIIVIIFAQLLCRPLRILGPVLLNCVRRYRPVNRVSPNPPGLKVPGARRARQAWRGVRPGHMTSYSQLTLVSLDPFGGAEALPGVDVAHVGMGVALARCVGGERERERERGGEGERHVFRFDLGHFKSRLRLHLLKDS